MTSEDLNILKEHCWEIQKENPLTLLNKETNSIATGYAIEIILSSYKNYSVDKCFLKKVFEIAHYKAEILHVNCENDPCLGEACLTKYLLDKSENILKSISELEKSNTKSLDIKILGA